MKVYVDQLLVLNFAVNYLLLRGTACLGAAAIRNKRLLLAAFSGAVYSVLVYLPDCQWLRLGVIKIVVAVIMLLIAFGTKTGTLRLAAVFAGLTLALCGAIYAVELLQNGRAHYRGTALFYPVSFFTLLLTAAAVSGACALLLPKLSHSEGAVLPVTLRHRTKVVHLSALQDTGNTLRDPISGAPVLTVYWKAARQLLPEGLEEQDFLSPAALALRLQALTPRLIPYRAVGIKAGLLLAIPCEITLNHQKNMGLVAFSPTPVSDGGAYEALTGGTAYA